MKRKADVLYEGKFYTLTGACIAAGLSLKSVKRWRSKHDMGLQEAFDGWLKNRRETPPSAPTNCKPVTYRGITYPTTLDACKALGVSYNCVLSTRHRLNFTQVSDAIDKCVRLKEQRERQLELKLEATPQQRLDRAA
jgi:hypothetical protein